MDFHGLFGDLIELHAENKQMINIAILLCLLQAINIISIKVKCQVHSTAKSCKDRQIKDKDERTHTIS